jgi:hypothetical protein
MPPFETNRIPMSFIMISIATFGRKKTTNQTDPNVTKTNQKGIQCHSVKQTEEISNQIQKISICH